jgi:hypothetical protein
MPAGTYRRRAWAGLTYEAGRLAILFLSLAATVFFLISLHYYFPGGAQHFIDWANILVTGGRANPDMAQRDIGYPLLLVLGGYPCTHSFVGITFINAAFAALMPLFVYGIIGRERPNLALFGVPHPPRRQSVFLCCDRLCCGRGASAMASLRTLLSHIRGGGRQLCPLSAQGGIG